MPSALMSYLLLSVAGGLADNQVGQLHVGAESRQLEPHELLDQGATVARNVLLRLLAPHLGPGAEADADPVHRQHDLLGDIDAEPSDHCAPRLLGIIDLLDPQAVHLGNDKVEVFHPFRAHLLRQVDVLISVGEYPEKPGVGLQVEPQLFPHSLVLTHVPLPGLQNLIMRMLLYN